MTVKPRAQVLGALEPFETAQQRGGADPQCGRAHHRHLDGILGLDDAACADNRPAG